MKGSLLLRAFEFPLSSVAADLRFKTAVVGGGIVGLATAARLSQAPTAGADLNNVVVLETHDQFLWETSSRNSGVVHAGIYYPAKSLKTKLCMEGNSNMWRLIERYPTAVSGRQCGKWIGACTVEEEAVLDALLLNMRERGIPGARYLSTKEVKEEEPNVCMRRVVISPITGIIDVHTLGNFFLKMIRVPERQSFATPASKVTAVHIDTSRRGHGNAPCVVCVASRDGTTYTVEADTVVFSAGLHSNAIGKEIPISSAPSCSGEVTSAVYDMVQRATYFCKGRYVGYRGKPPVSRLVYPCPLPNLKGLGVHSVVDMGGNLRFGPDAHYIDSYSDKDLRLGDPREGDRLCDEFHSAITRYIPTLERDRLYVDFTGVRPKLSRDGEGFRDFDMSVFNISGEEGGCHPPTLITLKGIESPGLTACTAIADHVAGIIWGDNRATMPVSFWGI